jgi:hypothetical protein
VQSETHFRRQNTLIGVFAVNFSSFRVEVFLPNQFLVPRDDSVNQRGGDIDHGGDVFESAQAEGQIR